jgi:hypothetical protein
MTIDKYFEEVKIAVDVCARDSISNQDYVESLISNNPEKTRDIIEIRKELLCSSDYQNLGGYLEIGFFTEFDPSERVALFSFMFDIGNDLKVKLLRNSFEKYEIHQPLFSGDQELFNCIRKTEAGSADLELIDSDCLTNIQDSEIFSRNGHFYKIDGYLNQALYPLCKQQFPDSRVFIRLDPTKIYSSQPSFQLNEEVLIPANPHWWQNLNIHRRNKEGASYILYPKEPTKESHQEFWEYNVKGIRRLDVIAKRNNDGNLSMMIEELSDKDTGAGITIGRCIHLDTDDEMGTPFNDSNVNHLDLAINVYEGNAAQKRYDGNLAKGIKVENATFRTHLLRIENVPLKSIFLFILVFFQSKTLISDWLANQFQRNESA